MATTEGLIKATAGRIPTKISRLNSPKGDDSGSAKTICRSSPSVSPKTCQICRDPHDKVVAIHKCICDRILSADIDRSFFLDPPVNVGTTLTPTNADIAAL